MATISNLFIDAGSDYSVIVTVRDSLGQPINLTDYTVKSQLRKSYKSSVFFDFDATVYDGPTGKIRLALSNDVTDEIEPGRWLYDVEITFGDGGPKRRVLEGIATVTPQITQT